MDVTGGARRLGVTFESKTRLRPATSGPQAGDHRGHHRSHRGQRATVGRRSLALTRITSKLVMRVRFSSPAPQQKPTKQGSQLPVAGGSAASVMVVVMYWARLRSGGRCRDAGEQASDVDLIPEAGANLPRSQPNRLDSKRWTWPGEDDSVQIL